MPKIVLKKFTITLATPHFFNPIVFKTNCIKKLRRLIPSISKNLWYSQYRSQGLFTQLVNFSMKTISSPQEMMPVTTQLMPDALAKGVANAFNVSHVAYLRPYLFKIQ